MSEIDLDRRALLQLGAGGLIAASILGARAAGASAAVFRHGVASGDPTARGVVLWTRVTPTDEAAPGSGLGPATTVEWAVGTDPQLHRVVARGRSTATVETDHTVHVDVRGLRPDTTYWYRFGALGEHSPVGRTRTLPAAGESADVRLGVVTCSELEWGYFSAYRALARRDDLTAVLFLGDYIYEYPAGSYDAGRTPGPSVGRVHQPAGETVTLSDYRLRYATYRSDPDLQALHAAHPAIAVWDDHETCNDAWSDGAQNHSADEGDYAERFLASRRAYLEWMPLRRPEPRTEPLRIYRSFRLGDLAELWMLDERSYRSQHAEAAFLTFGSVDPAIADPDRTILGPTQREWLLGGLADSTARWKLVGNPVMFTPYRVAADGQPLLDLLAEVSGTGVPVHHPVVATDEWGGYVAEQRAVVASLREIENVVLITGDAHASYANEVPLDPDTYRLDPRGVAVEFVAPGVTSPGLTKVIESQGLVGATRLEALLTANNTLANPWIRYYTGTVNGFGVLDLHATRARYEFWHLDDPMDPAAEPALAAAYEVRSGSTALTGDTLP
jgi:alkaline phosphatase D